MNGKKYLKRSNNIPMKVLGYLTPNEKYNELELAILKRNKFILLI